jgi:hypothetical protein
MRLIATKWARGSRGDLIGACIVAWYTRRGNDASWKKDARLKAYSELLERRIS